MGIVDKVMGGLTQKEQRDAIHSENASRNETGPEALALGKPSEHIVDDKIGGTHTRHVLDGVVHDNVQQHAHHEVTPMVNRQREETEIHQKIQPVTDKQEHHTHHQHVAPHVARNVQEDITEDHALKYRNQGGHHHQQTVGDQTHSTSVNAPIVREHVNKHIVEEVQPIIQRQTQKVEHHHTTQQINETHVKSPVVHDTVTNAPITMQEFAGKVGNAIGGHSHSGNANPVSYGNDGVSGSRGTGSSTGLGSSSGTTGGISGHHPTSSTGNTTGGGLGNSSLNRTGDGLTGSTRTGDGSSSGLNRTGDGLPGVSGGGLTGKESIHGTGVGSSLDSKRA